MRKQFSVVGPAMLLLLVVLQGYAWLSENAAGFGRVAHNLGQSAVWRGAAFSQGDRFADYILFLQEQIPIDFRVVLPPRDIGPKALGTTPQMQFFLQPRPVINCGDAACVENLSLERSAVLIVDDFPGEIVGEGMSARMLNNRWGVMLPTNAGSASLLEKPGSLAELAISAILPIAWLAVAALAGCLIIRRLLPESALASALPYGYIIGLSLASLGAGCLSLSGIKLTPASALAVSLFMLLVAFVGFVKPGKLLIDREQGVRLAVDPWQVFFLAVVLGAAFLSAGRGYSVSDELLLWGPKGYGIALEGSVKNVTDWGTNTVGYPLHVPLLIALFKLLSFEMLPASKLIFTGYLAALLFLVYDYLKQRGVTRFIAGLGVSALALTPIIFRHGTLAYANLPLSVCLVAAFITLESAVIKKSDPGRWLAGGLFLVAAAWTRPEGHVMAWAGAILTFAMYGLYQRGAPSRARVLSLFSPIVTYALFWILLKAVVYPEPASKAGVAGEALRQAVSGAWLFQDWYYVLRTLVIGLFTWDTWGLLGAAVMAGSIFLIIKRVKPYQSGSLLLWAGLLQVVLVAGMYFLTAYDQDHDIRWWLSTGLDRMLLPAVLLLFSGGIVVQLPDNAEDRSTALGLPDNRGIDV